MSDTQLRKALIRLAHDRPETREHILPLLRTATTPAEKWAWKMRDAQRALVTAIGYFRDEYDKKITEMQKYMEVGPGASDLRNEGEVLKVVQQAMPVCDLIAHTAKGVEKLLKSFARVAR